MSDEPLIVSIFGEKVSIPTEYLSYTYRITTPEGITTVGFMPIYYYHKWALRLLGISTVMKKGDTTIEVLPAETDAWAYGNKTLN